MWFATGYPFRRDPMLADGTHVPYVANGPNRRTRPTIVFRCREKIRMVNILKALILIFRICAGDVMLFNRLNTASPVKQEHVCP